VEFGILNNAGLVTGTVRHYYNNPKKIIKLPLGLIKKDGYMFNYDSEQA
jgi:hypothetical protein